MQTPQPAVTPEVHFSVGRVSGLCGSVELAPLCKRFLRVSTAAIRGYMSAQMERSVKNP